jgi:hypothetical protein
MVRTSFSEMLGLSFRVTGTVKNIDPKMPRNKPCRCGSGKKAKKCCLGPKPWTVYGTDGSPSWDEGKNAFGYALITGGDEIISLTELIAYITGKHKHAPEKRSFLLTAGDAETGESYRFATPDVALAYMKKAYPENNHFIILRLPSHYERLNTRFTRVLVHVVPE